MAKRIIGIDLAARTALKAIVLDQAGSCYVTGSLKFHDDPAELEMFWLLIEQVRQMVCN